MKKKDRKNKEYFISIYEPVNKDKTEYRTRKIKCSKSDDLMIFSMSYSKTEILHHLLNGGSFKNYLGFDEAERLLRIAFKEWFIKHTMVPHKEYLKWLKSKRLEDFDHNEIWNALGNFLETLRIFSRMIKDKKDGNQQAVAIGNTSLKEK